MKRSASDDDKEKYDEQNEMISFVMKIPKIGSNIRTIYINTPDNVEGKCCYNFLIINHSLVNMCFPYIAMA